MTTLRQLLFILNDMKESILALYNNTDRKLTEAKRKISNRSDLDIYFSNYRKDQFLKKCYLDEINGLISLIRLFIESNRPEHFEKILDYISFIIDFHISTVKPNKYGETNAHLNFSHQGEILVNSFDMHRVSIIYEELKIMSI